MIWQSIKHYHQQNKDDIRVVPKYLLFSPNFASPVALNFRRTINMEINKFSQIT